MGPWLRIVYVTLTVAAFGCSSKTEPSGGGSTVSCTSDLDCRTLGAQYTCVSAACRGPSGAGGAGSGRAAQGAVAEMIQPASGGPGCPASSPPFTAPANADPVSGTERSLNCDLSSGSGCTPDANVVVDGDNGALVKCTVSGGGDNFAVSASLGEGDVEFTLQGSISAAGGKAFVGSNYAQHGLQDPQCDIMIEANKGQIVPGAIWAAFNCMNFGDPSTGQSGCIATGKFIFENCAK